jgi:hypothetical protein
LERVKKELLYVTTANNDLNRIPRQQVENNTGKWTTGGSITTGRRCGGGYAGTLSIA